MFLQNYAIQLQKKVQRIIFIFPHSLRNNQAEQYTTEVIYQMRWITQ